MTSTALRPRIPAAIRVLDGALAALMGLGVAFGLVGVIAGLTSEENLSGVAVIVGGFILAVCGPGLLLLLAGLVRRARYGAGWSLLLAGRVVSGLALLLVAWWFWPWY